MTCVVSRDEAGVPCPLSMNGVVLGDEDSLSTGCSVAVGLERKWLCLW